MEFDYFSTRDAIWARSDLSFTEKGVALAALSFRNSKTGLCAPAVESDDPEKKTLCSKTGLTHICVRKTLKALEKKGVITLKKCVAKPSEITFVLGVTLNDVTLNDVKPKQRLGLPLTTFRATLNDVKANKEVIKKKIKKGDAHACASATPEEKKGSRITFTELTDELREQAIKVRPDLSPDQIAFEFDCFIDYWRAKAGAGAVKRDWPATWRNWIRRSNQFGANGGRRPVTQAQAVNEFKKSAISTRKNEEEEEAEAAELLFG
nr:MAG TPA: DNA-binding domain protein [Caudoviricetes sp.]